MRSLLESVPGWGVLRSIRPYLPPLNFITIHYLYFIVTCLIMSGIFYAASNPARSIGYTDSLFLIVSAMTEAGLNTVNLSTMTTFQQWLLWMHIMGGSTIFVSISVLHIRKRAFEKRFGAVLKQQRELRLQRRRTMTRTFSVGSQTGEPNFQRSIIPLRHVESAPAVPRQFSLSTVSPIRIGRQVSSPPTSQVNAAEQTNGNRIETIRGTSPAHHNTRLFTGSTEDIAPEVTSDQEGVNGNGTGNGDVPPGTGGQQAKHEHITFKPDVRRDMDDSDFVPGPLPRHQSIFSFTGVGARPVASTAYRRPGSESVRPRRPPRTASSAFSDHSEAPHHHHILQNAVIGRNSQFHGLSREEREHLGGIEYRSITLLGWIVPLYFVLWQLLGCLAIGAWMGHNAESVARENGIDPWWLGAFNAVSAFNNSGMSLLDANMIPFEGAYYVLITMSLLILAGNTAYPLFLRFILWSMYKILPNTPYYHDWKDTLSFVLEHPRRVYTNLFPARPTWWLLFTLVTLNGLDWLMFELLNLDNTLITDIPPGPRTLDGLFQALAVRSGGFYVVPITNLRIGVQVLYVIMMYISVYPVVITMRNSNVYEERSLGLYAEEEGSESYAATIAKKGFMGQLRRHVTGLTLKPAAESRSYFIRQQVQGQLAHDLSWLALAIFIIVCIEVSNFDRDPVTYSVFNIIFEVVSGYGCVGISTGLPNEAYSFSGGWHTVSKLILCAVMVRGRHRGLPVAIDRAVLLPGEGLGRKEEEDYELRRSQSRRRSGDMEMGGISDRGDGEVEEAERGRTHEHMV